MDFNRNQLTGPIPVELTDLPRIRYLDLSNNQLTGPVLQEFGTMSSLEDLGLNGNQLAGTIPPEIGNLTGLHTLGLGSNQLTGLVPQLLYGKLHCTLGSRAGNEGLYMPDTPEYRAADLTPLGEICYLGFTPNPSG